MNRRTSTLVEDLVHHVRARLLAGSYAAGERISESGIASEYGVARPTARTALDLLVGEGLLEKNPFAAFSVPSISIADLSEISALLEFTESLALAKVFATSPDLREVRDGAEKSLHFFLDAVVRVSGSERLARIHRQATFELLMGLAQAGIGAPDVPQAIRERMRETVSALWAREEQGALTALGTLQSWRGESLARVAEASATRSGPVHIPGNDLR